MSISQRLTSRSLEQRVRVGLWSGVLGAVIGLVYAWLLAHHSYGDNYVYGRPLIFGVLLLLVGIYAWRLTLPRISTAVVAVGLALIAIGVIGDYWIGVRNNVTLWRLGFIFELFGSALALIATTVLGVMLLRARLISAWIAGLMVGVIPVGVALLGVMMGYIPSDPVGALCVVWGSACLQRAQGRLSPS